MVYIVGAGAGDPELITVKGQRLLKNADVVIYAGSLVNPKLLENCKADAEIYNSATMTLEEVLNVIETADAAGKNIVRLHTGDPSIYGAIQEQIDALDAKNIAVEVVPGVSSFLAAAATLKQEYTLPGVTQTVIITRAGGKTPVPAKESLKNLAAHETTLCIFLSISLIENVVEDLLDAGLNKDTPIAVVKKASWQDEKVLRGTLENIAEKVKAEKIERTALIIVGNCLNKNYEKSLLYSPHFSHMFRK
jgi:precorrin-4/cobalt-precorrin-4 C11-methyltransferase